MLKLHNVTAELADVNYFAQYFAMHRQLKTDFGDHFCVYETFPSLYYAMMMCIAVEHKKQAQKKKNEFFVKSKKCQNSLDE